MVHLRNTGPLEEENHLNQTINLRFYVNLRGFIWSYMHMWAMVNYCKMASRRGFQIEWTNPTNVEVFEILTFSVRWIQSVSLGQQYTLDTYSIYVHPQNHINHKIQKHHQQSHQKKPVFPLVTLVTLVPSYQVTGKLNTTIAISLNQVQ